MFYLGLAAILLVTLLLGLTILRLLEKRPNPNAEMLAEMLESLDRPVPENHARSKADPIHSGTRIA